jgi:hypothetical protein
MERERRKTLSEKEQLNRMVREIEKENQRLKGEIDNDEANAERVRNEVR